MSITNSQGGTGQRRGLSLLGDLLGTLPGYEGIELDAIEHGERETAASPRAVPSVPSKLLASKYSLKCMW